MKKFAHHPIVVDVVAEEDIPTFIFGTINDGTCTMYIVWCNDDDVHNDYVNYQVHSDDDDDDDDEFDDDEFDDDDDDDDDDLHHHSSVSIQVVHYFCHLQSSDTPLIIKMY